MKDIVLVAITIANALIYGGMNRNCPTLFMYHKGDLKNQLLSIRKLGGLDMKVEGTARSCFVSVST